MTSNINWLELINNQLPDWLRLEKNDSIFIHKFDLFSNRLDFLGSLDKRYEFFFDFLIIFEKTFRQLANIIFIEILYGYRNLIEVYPFNHKQYKQAIKTPQRFEICNGLVDSYMPLPAKALFSRRFFPKSFKASAEELMKAAASFINEKYNMSRKPVEFIAGYPSDSIDDSFLNKIYQNLPLLGNESLLETYRELSKFQNFIDLVELERKDFETLKILKTVGQNTFSCSMIRQKVLCE